MEFDSDDPAIVEDFMSRVFVTMRFDPGREKASPTSWSRIQVGPWVKVDRFRFGCSMSYTAEPLGAWCVCAMRAGGIEHTDSAGETTSIATGEMASLSAPGEPQTGLVRDTFYDIVWIDPAYLTRVAGAHGDGAPVRILGHHGGPGGARMLRAVLDHVRDPGVRDAIGDAPLVADSLARHLTAAVTSGFAITTEPDKALDRTDAHPETVRRAIAFLETHVREEITLADIAAAAYVSARAVQLAFRRHLDTTPLRYLQRLRLAGAHEHLRRAVPGDRQTVTSIAHHWGLTHPGRFAVAYRRAYGCSPRETLNR